MHMHAVRAVPARSFVASLAALLLLVLTPLAAQATINPDGASTAGYTDFRGIAASADTMAATGSSPAFPFQLGTFQVPGYNVRGVCANSNKAQPSSVGAPIIVSDSPAGAYLLARYVDAPADVDAAALHIALGSAKYGLGLNGNTTWLDMEIDHLGTSPAFSSHVAQAKARASQMLSEAKQYAGPYRPEVTLGSTAPFRTGAATFTVVNAAGVQVPNVTTTLTLTGPAVFDATGTNTLQVTTDAAGNVSAPWHATSAGQPVGIRSGQAEVASTSYVLYPSVNDAQGMYAHGATTMLQAKDGAPVTPAALTPKATSTASDEVVMATAGKTLSDNLTVTGGAAGTTQPGTLAVYGPLDTMPAQGAVPADAKPAGSYPVAVKYDANGNATFSGGALQATKPGYYTWVLTAAATAENAAITTAYGDPLETTLVIAPSVGTQTSNQSALVGETIYDTSTQTGIVTKSPTGETITYELSGTLAGVPAGPQGCTGLDWSKAVEELKIPATPITADGPVKLGEFKVTTEGCKSYGERLAVTYKGQVIGTVEHTVGQTPQTTVVTQPKIGTQASTTTVTVGGDVHDTVKVEGTQGRPGTITWTYYVLPSREGCYTTEQWQAAIKDGSAKAEQTGTLQVNADGAIDTPTFKTQTVGCGTFAEVGRWGDTVVEHLPGQPTQSLTVTPVPVIPVVPVAQQPAAPAVVMSVPAGLGVGPVANPAAGVVALVLLALGASGGLVVAARR